MRSQIKLFVFDLDGTALGGHVPYDQFPKPFADFLDDLARRGCRWATNTTWHPGSQLPVIQRSRVKSTPAFLSGGTGLFLAAVRRGRLVFDRRHGQAILRLQRAFHRRHGPQIGRIFRNLLSRNLVESVSYNVDRPQCVLTYACRPSKARAVLAEVKPLIQPGIYYDWNPAPRPVNVTLLPCFMNKRDIVGVMQKRLGLTAEQTLVAGDGINDLAMMNRAAARWAVCPDNADARIKQAVRAMGGVVARRRYSWGVMEGVLRILDGLT